MDSHKRRSWARCIRCWCTTLTQSIDLAGLASEKRKKEKEEKKDKKGKAKNDDETGDGEYDDDDELMGDGQASVPDEEWPDEDQDEPAAKRRK